MSFETFKFVKDQADGAGRSCDSPYRNGFIELSLVDVSDGGTQWWWDGDGFRLRHSFEEVLVA